MIESDVEKSRRLSTILFGKALAGSELDELISQHSTFRSFRAALVDHMSSRNSNARVVVDHWRDQLRMEQSAADANALLTKLENIVMTQRDLEKKLRDGMTELLNQMSAIDRVASAHGACQNTLAELQTQIATLRNRIDAHDALPATSNKVGK